ncbi:MAG: nicotinate-nucleotide adenylyltransferase [Gammaproteobacteria bacterium]|nr:nicotinate-nucleotide adenylyltransferase [Gammaproteobacteria bacterium]
MTRIGFFGGTFDPIHFGHLRPALELRDVLGLDEVLFVPCRVPPHRVHPRASPEVRAGMVERAIAGVPGFTLDRRELDRDGPSFTVDSLADLHDERPGAQLLLLLGMDAFLGLGGWHRPERVFELAHLVVTHRPGWKRDEQGGREALIHGRICRRPEELAAEPVGKVLFVEVTQLEISATAVRVSAAANGDVRYLVPEVVREFIEETGCYQND